ncbi:MAG: hypothetical protein E3J21_20120 [Anaerolineales bacterium]|nr:MAG: hypothetical protein E3J21_20120 [Anaerolineales bacterium]
MTLSKIADSKKHILEYLSFALILVLATVLSCYKIAEPAWDDTHGHRLLNGHQGASLVEFSLIARNYLKFGYLRTKLGQVTDYGRSEPQDFRYRIDNPPLLPLLISLSFRLFGVNEWSARLVPLLSSTGLLFVVYWLGHKLGGKRVALVASFIFALLPMQVYYGKMPAPHILSSFFSWLTFVFYLCWIERREPRYHIGIYPSFLLAALSGWIGYFVVPLILLHYLACEYKKSRNLRFVFSFAIMPIVLFAVHLGWACLLEGREGFNKLFDLFLFRALSGGASEGRFVFTMWDFYAAGYTRSGLFFTGTVCVLSTLWLTIWLVAPFWKRLSRWDMFIPALIVFGLSHNLVFRNLVYIHDFTMLFHFAPLFAITAALGTQFIVNKVLANKWMWTIPFILAVGYCFGTQSDSALRQLHKVAILPDIYLLGTKISEITDESTKVLSSLGLDYRMGFYADRPWAVTTDLDTLVRLSQADSRYSLYVLDSASTEGIGRNLKEYLVRNYPVETFYGYSFFDLRDAGSNTILQNPRIEHPADVTFDDKLMFLGYNAEEVVQKKREPSWLEKYLKGHAELLPEHRTFFRITYFWRCLEEMEKDYTLVTQFDGHHGKTYRIDQSHQGVNGAYPTPMWRVGEVIREEYQVEVPADYPPIRYALWVGVRDGEERLEVMSDVEADEENRVRLGEIEILPAERPSPLAAEPQPQNRVEVNINDELVLLGYDLSERNLQPGDQLRVTTYWQSLGKTERDYAIQVELRNGGYKVREILDIAPTRLWEEGGYYQSSAVIAVNPHILGGTYSLNLGLERDDGTGMQASLASLDIPRQRRHIIRRLGKANYGGSEIISPDEPLSLRFDLGEREALELVAGWTGKAGGEETRVEVYITNAYWRDRYLGTWVMKSGDYRVTKRKIGKVLTAPGQNVIELRVPEVRERVHNVGWRGVVDRVFPDLLQDPRTDYDGPIQIDFAQVSSRWEEDWDDYYDLAKVYTERGMIGEVARLYEEAVDKGVEPGQVDDLALFKEAYRALGEEGKVGEIEERIAGHIAHKVNVNLGDKVEFLGHSLRGKEGDDQGISLFFRCLEGMEEDYTLWVHGEVEDESLLEGRRREARYAVFDHLLPTSRWEAEEVYQDDDVKGLRPGRYHFTLGLWRPEDGSRLWWEDDPNAHVIDLGWVEVR